MVTNTTGFTKEYNFPKEESEQDTEDIAHADFSVVGYQLFEC